MIETQKKIMESMMENRGWKEARLQYEFSRGEQADHLFIKARHAPRAHAQPTLSLPALSRAPFSALTLTLT